MRGAGIELGMRVLDVGCGAGDVSFLVARLVRPEGSVIGVDSSATAVDTARARARAAELDMVADAADLSLDVPVDALVGRLILMYLTTGALGRLVRIVRPGGVVAFQELHAAGATSHPPCPTYDQAVARIAETLTRVGCDPDTGLDLWHRFLHAGLDGTVLLQTAPVEPPPAAASCAQVLQITRTLIGAMERTGVATAAEVDLDTLATRLDDEILDRRAVIVFPPLIAAWARTPLAA
jgi:SAM-dependent methyltransferase